MINKFKQLLKQRNKQSGKIDRYRPVNSNMGGRVNTISSNSSCPSNSDSKNTLGNEAALAYWNRQKSRFVNSKLYL